MTSKEMILYLQVSYIPLFPLYYILQLLFIFLWDLAAEYGPLHFFITAFDLARGIIYGVGPIVTTFKIKLSLSYPNPFINLTMVWNMTYRFMDFLINNLKQTISSEGKFSGIIIN